MKSKKIKLNIVKINLLGNTTAGKTSLIKCLNFDDKNEDEILKTIKKNFNPPENSTHGMKIWEKSLGDINIIAVDFGGQDYFHGTYNIFLSGGISLLLFTNPETGYEYSGEDKEIEITYNQKKVKEPQTLFPPKYWLKKIQKANFNKPIIQIQTKLDYEDKENPSDKFDNTTENSDFQIGLEVIKNGDGKLKLNGSNRETNLKKSFLDLRDRLIREIIDFNEGREETVFTVELLKIVENLRKNSELQISMNLLYEEEFKKNEQVQEEFKKLKKSEEYLKDAFITSLQSLKQAGKVVYKNKNDIEDTVEGRLKFFEKNQPLKIFINIPKLQNLSKTLLIGLFSSHGWIIAITSHHLFPRGIFFGVT